MNSSSSSPSGGRPGGHAVVRSSELLSCARTALRITQQEYKQKQLQQQQQQTDLPNSTSANESALLYIDPSSLTLHQSSKQDDPNNGPTNQNPALEALYHASLSLRLLDTSLVNLSSLVRRRGHTNDPTDEIHKAISQFRLYATEIKEILEKTLQNAARMDFIVDKMMHDSVNDEDAFGRRTKSSGQRVRHYEIIGLLLKERMEDKLKRFKEVMKVREGVIKEMTRRRKELLENDSSTLVANSLNGTTRDHRAATTGIGVIMPALVPKSSSSSKTKITSQLGSPLFTNTSTNPRNDNKNTCRNGSTSIVGKSGYGSTINAGYGYGGTTNSGYGYGGGYDDRGGARNVGLRQRAIGNGGSSNSYKNDYSKADTTNRYRNKEKIDSNAEYEDQQSLLQIQERRTMRRTNDRLRSARQAEAQLADLTGMFGKMSELIHSQGETLEKIEDDVEAGNDYVNAGVEEIGKLHEIKKGNRSLIIKVFAILIFFIIAMKWF